jgi:hypothetical protein
MQKCHCSMLFTIKSPCLKNLADGLINSKPLRLPKGSSKPMKFNFEVHIALVGCVEQPLHYCHPVSGKLLTITYHRFSYVLVGDESFALECRQKLLDRGLPSRLIARAERQIWAQEEERLRNIYLRVNDVNYSRYLRYLDLPFSPDDARKLRQLSGPS